MSFANVMVTTFKVTTIGNSLCKLSAHVKQIFCHNRHLDGIRDYYYPLGKCSSVNMEGSHPCIEITFIAINVMFS